MGSLVVVGFNPAAKISAAGAGAASSAAATIGCMGRTALHDAICESSAAVQALLDKTVDPAEFEQMATHRDNSGMCSRNAT